MKKALLTGILLLLLTTAPLTAGCTTTAIPDPIEGTWTVEDPLIIEEFNGSAAAECILIFESGGVGKAILVAAKETGNTQAGISAEHTLTWKKTAENTYTIAIASFKGTVEITMTLNGDTLTADTGVQSTRSAGHSDGAIFDLRP